MTPTQLDLLGPLEPVSEPQETSGHQHAQILAALLAEGPRGLCGEEAALRCGFRETHIATSRLNELMASNEKDRRRFPVPLVYRSEKRERKTASGVKSFVYWLTDEGQRAARAVRSTAA